jgi:hypothetical protein
MDVAFVDPATLERNLADPDLAPAYTPWLAGVQAVATGEGGALRPWRHAGGGGSSRFGAPGRG